MGAKDVRSENKSNKGDIMDRSRPRFSDRGLSVFCFALKLSCLSSFWHVDRSEMAPRVIVVA